MEGGQGLAAAPRGVLLPLALHFLKTLQGQG
jgi:hypothetical protein